MGGSGVPLVRASLPPSRMTPMGPIFSLGFCALVWLVFPIANASASTGNGVGQIAYMHCYFAAGESVFIEDGRCRVWQDRGGTLRVEEQRRPGFRFRIGSGAGTTGDRVFWNGERSADAAIIRLGVGLSRTEGRETCWQSRPSSDVPFSLCISRP